jgi:hypothetical protein
MSGSVSYTIDLEIPIDSIEPLNFIISAVDQIGNWVSISEDVAVMDVIEPISQPGPDMTSDEDSPTILDGSLSSDNIAIVNWTWSFSDGDDDVTLYGKENSYIFNQPGRYRVLLKVSDAAGNWQKTPFDINVNDITDPVIVVSSMDFVENEVATFDGSGCSDNVGIVNWTWTFDDGGGSETLYGESPNYTFSEQGKYRVNLTVRDGAGNTATDTFLLNVRDDDRWIRDHWWVIPIILVVLIVAVFIFLVMKEKIIQLSPGTTTPETTKQSPEVSAEK